MRREEEGRETHGVFVTYKVNGVLRGCTGGYGRQGMLDGVAKYAIASALQDKRFHPVVVQELPSLSCEVALLSERTPISPWNTWLPGTHGIFVELLGEEGKTYASAFLPDTIFDNGWSKKQTMSFLLQKAGYQGPLNTSTFERCQVSTFTGDLIQCDYKEYKKMYRTEWGFTPSSA